MVSPVIGVILMTAIVIILMAVISAFVWGIIPNESSVNMSDIGRYGETVCRSWNNSCIKP